MQARGTHIGRRLRQVKEALVLLFLTTILGVTRAASAETITLPPLLDGTIYESVTNAESSGAGPTMFVGRIQQSGGFLRRGLIQFDLQGAIPAGQVVTGVELKMRLSRTAPDLTSTELSLHRATSPWGEGTSNAGALGGLGAEAMPGDATWLQGIYPDQPWNHAGGDFLAVASASVEVSELGDFTWQSSPELVDDVILWLAHPDENYGWFILGDEAQSGTAVRLDARENANIAARPELRITYEVPEPASVAIAGVGLMALMAVRHRRALAQSVCATVAILACCSTVQAQPDMLPSIPVGNRTVRLEQVADGLNGMVGDTLQYAPTDMVFAPDGSGRMFVVTLGGAIRVGTPQGGLMPEVFLDTFSEQTDILPDSFGMTAMTFHPDFANPGSPGYGKFYTLEPEKKTGGAATLPLSLTGRQKHQTALFEYTAVDPAANAFTGTKRQVFRIDEPGEIHNTNELLFGPDGYLYVAAGDGCNEPNATGTVCSDNAQYLGNSFGKVLRFDPLDPAVTSNSNDPISASGAYRIPADNPFVNESNALGEIFAYGLRNPYRLSFDRASGELYAGDVGQRNIETIDRIVAGGNYGWNGLEGTFLYDKTSQNELVPDADLNGDGKGDYAAEHGMQEPLFQYDHQDGKSVVGGYVYRGELLPELNGKYLFGDFRGPLNRFEGKLYLGDFSNETLEQLQVSAAGDELPDLIYAFSEDESGELYLLGGAKDGSTGVVMRIVRAFPFGDTNADGQVNLADLNNVRNNFGGVGLGDANSDGKVDLQDLNAVRNNFGATTPSTVPEPSAFGLLAIAALAALTWRQRRGRFLRS